MTQGALTEINIPDEWDWERLWSAAPRVQLVGQPDAEPLSVFLQAGVVPRSSREDNHNQLGEDLSKYQVVQPGDLVFNKLRTWQGGLGVSDHHGIVSPAYFVCRPKNDWHPRYLHYLLLSKPYLAELTRLSKFMPPSQFDIPWDMLRTLPLLHPPLAIQQRIASFLDAETSKIGNMASLRSLQENKLNEREASWRNQFFFNSKSGTWVRVKHLLSAKPRYGVLVPEFVDDGVPFIRVKNLPGVISREGLAKIPEELSAQYSRTVTMLGDVLVSVVGSLGKTTVVTEDLTGANTARAVAVLRLKQEYSPSLFATWIDTPEFKQQALLATGADSAQPTLGMEDLANFSVRWPADGTEQKGMAEEANQHRLQADLAHSMISRQLAVLTERRQALITAAVTGQIVVTTAGGVAI
jgi:type I restriction enzyme, S subunit